MTSIKINAAGFFCFPEIFPFSSLFKYIFRKTRFLSSEFECSVLKEIWNISRKIRKVEKLHPGKSHFSFTLSRKIRKIEDILQNPENITNNPENTKNYKTSGKWKKNNFFERKLRKIRKQENVTISPENSRKSLSLFFFENRKRLSQVWKRCENYMTGVKNSLQHLFALINREIIVKTLNILPFSPNFVLSFAFLDSCRHFLSLLSSRLLSGCTRAWSRMTFLSVCFVLSLENWNKRNFSPTLYSRQIIDSLPSHRKHSCESNCREHRPIY